MGTMDKSKIIKFPTPKKPEPMDHELDMTRLLMQTMVKTLLDYRYDPTEEGMADDLGVIYTMVYAMMIRADGGRHQFHEMMTELATELKRLGEESDSD